MKIGEQAQLAISRSLAAILEKLSKTGPLFPTISTGMVNLRAAEFYYLVVVRTKLERAVRSKLEYHGWIRYFV